MKRWLKEISRSVFVPLSVTLALAAGLALSFRYSLTITPGSVGKSSESSPKKPGAKEELCTDLVLSQMTGRDLMSVGAAYTRRMRRGPIVIGVREMVIERLNFVLPESYFHPMTATNAVGGKTEGIPVPLSLGDSLGELTSGKGRVSKMLPVVAGLRINGLQISRLQDGTNAVPWLRAERGSLSARDAGLALRGVELVEQGVTNVSRAAFLEYKPYVRIRTDKQ